MTAVWMRPGNRLDVELAVALDMGARLLTRARSPRQLDQAISYNLRLWRSVRRLAEFHSVLIEREILADAADHVAVMLVVDSSPCPDPRDITFIAGRNIAVARDLAGLAASQRGLAEMLGDWSGAGRLETWLLERIESHVVPA